MENGKKPDMVLDIAEDAAYLADMTVAVIGLGKVGLPLAVQYAGAGARVIGCDINPAVVAAVNAGEAPIHGEADLPERLRSVHDRGLLTAVTDTREGVGSADVVVVIVPLMIKARHRIDFRAIDAATEAVGAGLKRGALVIYETTLPVGTTRDRFGGILERASGLRMGEDFYLAFSPERIRTGRIFRDLATYPKVVGGIDAESTARAARFYRATLKTAVREMSSAESAEYSKLVECTYRDVNIALANEFARFAERRGINVFEAIDAANSQPQSHVHEPGIGVGGHCIPVYPYFLINSAEPGEMQLQRSAREINDGMAEHAVALLAEQLGDLRGKHVLILGLAYRANVKESAYSTTRLLIPELERNGAIVWVNDPLFSDEEIIAAGGAPVALDAVERIDAIIIQAYHREYDALGLRFFEKASVVLDGRAALDTGLFTGADVTYLRIGVATAPSLVDSSI